MYALNVRYPGWSQGFPLVARTPADAKRKATEMLAGMGITMTKRIKISGDWQMAKNDSGEVWVELFPFSLDD